MSKGVSRKAMVDSSHRRARFRWLGSACRDCRQKSDHYMVRDEVWAAARMAPLDGFLCVPCLERRLDRPLTCADLLPVDANKPSELDTDYLAHLKTQLQTQ